jgi:signal transduction histidine kinase
MLKVAEIIESMSFVHSNSIQFISNIEPIVGSWGINGIKRALENIITNAIKYGTPNTTVVVKLTND